MTKDGLLGSFEEQVLLAVLHAGDEPYGMTIRREIEARTGRSVTIGAVYATLDRLEDKGLLDSWTGDPDDSRSGRARRYFRLEPAGEEALARSREVHSSMWEGIELDRAPGES